MRIGSRRIDVGSVANRLVGRGDEDRREFCPGDALLLISRASADKSHIEIPLVFRGEGLHAPRNRMTGQYGELRLPYRIAREHVLVMTADPALELIAGLIRDDFDA